MLAGFQEWEAAGSEHRGGSNKDWRDRHIVGRLGILPGLGENWPEMFKESSLHPLFLRGKVRVWDAFANTGPSVSAHCSPEG